MALLLSIYVTGIVLISSADVNAQEVDTQNLNLDELRSAIAVSQLVLAQQAEFFKELVNITKTANNCLEDKTDSICPYPFNHVVNECFYISKKSLPWAAARQYCQGTGGDLATPKNLYALKAHVIEKRGPRSMWIGGLDQGGGRWLWVNGSPVNTEDWANKKPTNRRGAENCLNLRRDWHPVLSDLACVKRQAFICQYPV